MIAHLDAMDGRLTAHLDAFEARMMARFADVDRQLGTIIDSVADLRRDLNEHIARGHED